MEHKFIVTISGCDYTKAHIVMAERMGYDEDYGFDYEVDWEDA